MENPSKGHFMSQSYKSPLAKKGFEIAKPHLKAAASNIASNAVKHVMERFAGDQEMKQEGSGGIMVLSRRKRRRPPGERIPSSFNKQPFAITDGGPIEFFIPGDGDRYLDLNDTLLHLRVKITNPNGSNLANDAASSATHPYRCMIETLLNFSPDTLSSQFTGGLFYKDTAGSVDSIVLVNGPNNGLTRESRVHSPFQRIRLGHAAALMKGNALYPLSRVNVKTYSIPANSRVCNQENLFLGSIPKYVVLGMVHHEAFTGRRDLSPFNFRHYDIEYLALCQDGRQVPAKAFQPDFNNGVSVREFYNMFLATGRHLKDLPLSISRDDFNDGYSLFVFNLNPSDDNDALSTVSNGNLRLELRFRTPLPHTATLIVYACYDSILEINAKRQVLVDYY
ncbi:hypothetical protein D4764_09G0010330 [Takifugu flavidus]|uniref:Uncharacterized protein n=1 Tax=Takifugu flavidus TaxID=433684 RepID=A0A5C6MM92_9TELE|nr:hypothetical protein D4764_09G0010330 [Takifugu flavidus]